MGNSGNYRGDNDDTTIKGGTDSTVIGNTNDRLRVETSFADNSVVDAFGRTRVSQASILFNAYFTETDKSLLFTQNLTGGGTVTRDVTEGQLHLETTTASGDKTIFQSKEYIHYIPGQSVKVLVSAKFSNAQTNLTQRIGFFDENNGVFFELEDNTLYAVLRSNNTGVVVDERVAQSSWSFDKLDGTGDSGITLDISKQNIFAIDFQWLGAGRVRFGFSINGQDIVAHAFNNANNKNLPYNRTGSLPVRCEVENTGVIASAANLKLNCMAVTSEGLIDAAVITRSVDNFTSTKAISTSVIRPLISIRLKSANIRGTILPKAFTILATSQDDLLYRVVLNPASLTGASWTSVSPTSIAEFDTSAIAVSGGEVLQSGYVSKAGGEAINLSLSFLKIVADYAGTADILTLEAISLTSSAQAVASIRFEERF